MNAILRLIFVGARSAKGFGHDCDFGIQLSHYRAFEKCSVTEPKAKLFVSSYIPWHDICPSGKVKERTGYDMGND
jgi:hypothetical protein